MSKVAFELRADAEKESFSGGTVSLPGGEAYNVGEALAEGKGKIVLTTDPTPKKAATAKSPAEYDPEELERAAHAGRIAEALDAFPALKRTTAADGGTASTSTEKEGDS